MREVETTESQELPGEPAWHTHGNTTKDHLKPAVRRGLAPLLPSSSSAGENVLKHVSLWEPFLFRPPQNMNKNLIIVEQCGDL